VGTGDKRRRRPKRLERAFFARPAPEVAPELLGKLLIKADDGIVARLVEVEAYTQEDPASHAYRGPTARNAPMFGPPGHAYVYFSYGMHWCMNTVTGEDGHGQGVLLRAAEPLEGLDVIRRRRGTAKDRDLLRGPGRLGQAYGLHRQHSGLDLCDGGPLYLADDGERPAVTTGPRVGVALGADEAWRFWVPDSTWASVYKRSPRAPASPIARGRPRS
jgi:DNA-3-methyladenine glycosylase